MYDDDEIAPPRLNNSEIFENQPDFLKTTINRERFFGVGIQMSGIGLI